MKLATIEQIIDIIPIDGADAIELAKVSGYQSVVKKGEYSKGDTVVFIHPDTIVPEGFPQATFLEKYKWRVRPMKLRGVLSQGLVIPYKKEFVDENIYELLGNDIGEKLGITKYEKPIPAQLAGQVVGDFPSQWISKTDEPRLLSYMELMDDFQGLECYISLKMDGSSGTYIMAPDGNFSVSSRNLQLKENDGNTFWRLAKQYGLREKLQGYSYAIQGEVVGEGIQKNRAGIKGHKLYIFNIKDLLEMRYLSLQESQQFCEKFELDFVPIVNYGIFNYSIEELQKLANEQTYSNGNPAEGIVIRPCKYLTSKFPKYYDMRVSAKVISENYLAKYGD